MDSQLLWTPVTHHGTVQSSTAANAPSSASPNHQVQPCSDQTLCELASCPRATGKALAGEGQLGHGQGSLKSPSSTVGGDGTQLIPHPLHSKPSEDLHTAANTPSLATTMLFFTLVKLLERVTNGTCPPRSPPRSHLGPRPLGVPTCRKDPGGWPRCRQQLFHQLQPDAAVAAGQQHRARPPRRHRRPPPAGRNRPGTASPARAAREGLPSHPWGRACACVYMCMYYPSQLTCSTNAAPSWGPRLPRNPRGKERRLPEGCWGGCRDPHLFPRLGCRGEGLQYSELVSSAQQCNFLPR